jgi:dolichol-phosphate mannosyltransferase
MPAASLPADQPEVVGSPHLGEGAWVVVPTYNEADNLPGIARSIVTMLPSAVLLVVDDSSPDGTGEIADALAAENPRIRVLHRRAKTGLGPAYLEGFRAALAGGATIVVQSDADGSHDPAALPELLAPIVDGTADLVLGSRYVHGGGTVGWGPSRKLLSRGGSLYAGIVLRLPVRDLTGGFKAWRSSCLGSLDFDRIGAGGYVFQIEMTYRASRAGARIVEVPIIFRDRRVGHSKMSRRIIAEALLVVLRLRWDELRGRG